MPILPTFTKEQMQELCLRVGDVEKVEEILNKFKTYLCSKDVKDIYDDIYEEKIANTPIVTKFSEGSIHIYNAYTFEYLKKKMHEVGIRDILEIGCGNGQFLKAVASEYHETKCVGVDFSENNIRCAKENSQLFNCEFYCQDVNEWKTDEKFDIIILNDVIEHLADQEIYKLLETCKMTLGKENSVIIMHTPNGLNKYSQTDKTLKTKLIYGLINWISRGENTKIQKSFEQLYYEQVHINVKSARKWKEIFKKRGYRMKTIYDNEKSIWNKKIGISSNMLLIATKVKGA